MNLKTVAVTAAVACAAMLLVGCTPTDTPKRSSQLEKSQASFDSRTPPSVTGDAEYHNYMKAQEEVYDNPATIIWCTASFPNPASPIFTVPIAGKLTSSSVSYYPNKVQKFSSGGSFTWSEETQSVDGMYHGAPPAYRYGFTPGGQYMDFSNMSVLCTTALTSFQRETLTVAVTDTHAANVTDQAEAKLKAGDAAGAQALLDGLSK